MPAVVHMIVESTPTTVKMRCGKIVRDPVHSPGSLFDAEGNECGVTVLSKRVTCKKCKSLLKEGTIHAKHKLKRAASNARAPAPRATRSHARARA